MHLVIFLSVWFIGYLGALLASLQRERMCTTGNIINIHVAILCTINTHVHALELE